MGTKITNCELKFRNTREKITMEVTLQKLNQTVNILDFFCDVLKKISCLQIEFSKGEYKITNKTEDIPGDACGILQLLPSILQILQNFCVSERQSPVIESEAITSKYDPKSAEETLTEATTKHGQYKGTNDWHGTQPHSAHLESSDSKATDEAKKDHHGTQPYASSLESSDSKATDEAKKDHHGTQPYASSLESSDSKATNEAKKDHHGTQPYASYPESGDSKATTEAKKDHHGTQPNSAYLESSDSKATNEAKKDHHGTQPYSSSLESSDPRAANEVKKDHHGTQPHSAYPESSDSKGSVESAGCKLCDEQKGMQAVKEWHGEQTCEGHSEESDETDRSQHDPVSDHQVMAKRPMATDRGDSNFRGDSKIGSHGSDTKYTSESYKSLDRQSQSQSSSRPNEVLEASGKKEKQIISEVINRNKSQNPKNSDFPSQKENNLDN